MTIGIMTAMEAEIRLLMSSMMVRTRETHGMREYLIGKIGNKEVTLVLSGWGKVAASSAATTLVDRYGADLLILGGVAGALDSSLRVGDIVIADSLVQHDMDASAIPGIRRFEVPVLNTAIFRVEASLVQVAESAANQYIRCDLPVEVSPEVMASFGLYQPAVRTGLVASGDRFIASEADSLAIRRLLPHTLCVEMEGAAVAQVGHEHSVPYIVIRTISDNADHSAVVDFGRFIESIAAHFTRGVVLRVLESLGAD